MMNNIPAYLLSLRNDVFKLLPMKEASDKGEVNHINDYICSLITVMEGGALSYPVLGKERQYIYTVNNLRYLATHSATFTKWRKTILNSTRTLDDLRLKYDKGGERDEQG